ncbi:hypothetical protein [Macrococcoides caseolyticum]|uniref:hypothetical protein n=1 Tax=Macrococcoides caseolyticum TaxID=69966 RepID=UPI001F359BE2|nr:hypothetical protein [Macrococcus caseolyticus]MCE4956707.1 hypothetical protein [Macrococcus caseolyticus]
MQPLKRIIYCIKVIIKSEDEVHPMYHVTYHYLVQAVSLSEPIKLDDSIYNKVSFPSTAIRYLDIIETEEIEPSDSDYEMYLHLYQSEVIQLFHSKAYVTYQLNEVHQ